MVKIIELYNDKLAEKYDEAILKGKWKPPSETHKILSQTGLIKRGLKIMPKTTLKIRLLF